jgi:DNA-binding transcriptional regulator GbsR (MarR family)
MTARISAAQSDFIEAMGLFGVESGSSRSLTRVMGFLLICEPVYQSAAEIQRVLKLSAGSVSNALMILQQAEIVQRRTFSGDRHYYYQIDPASFKAFVLKRLETMSKGAQIAERGLAISPGNERLQAMFEIYTGYAAEVENIKKRLGPA